MRMCHFRVVPPNPRKPFLLNEVLDFSSYLLLHCYHALLPVDSVEKLCVNTQQNSETANYTQNIKTKLWS